MNNNYQVTVPRYRENPLIVKFTLLCPGISQNSKHHHLTLYKGQVWGEKSYTELCNNNILNILYDPLTISNIYVDKIEQNGELFIPPTPGYGFSEDLSQIPFDSEIIESFAEMTNVTYISLHSYLDESSKDVKDYQLKVGTWMCPVSRPHKEQCSMTKRYEKYYIWTKGGFKIKLKLFTKKKEVSFVIFNTNYHNMRT